MTAKPEVPDGVESEQNRNKVRGVDGLDVGHHYSLRSGSRWGYVRWWEYGEKDEVVNPPGGRLDWRKVAYRRTRTPHPGVRMEVEGLPEIEFWCIE